MRRKKTQTNYDDYRTTHHNSNYIRDDAYKNNCLPSNAHYLFSIATIFGNVCAFVQGILAFGRFEMTNEIFKTFAFGSVCCHNLAIINYSCNESERIAGFFEFIEEIYSISRNRDTSCHFSKSRWVLTMKNNLCSLF